MKAHITTKCKPCPFCGARADEIESITGLSMIACSNYNGCGAIVLAIIGLVWLLADHPVVLFSIVAAVIFVILTICFYVGGNAT